MSRGNCENEAASEMLEYEAARFSQQTATVNGCESRRRMEALHGLVASRGKSGGYTRRNDDGGVRKMDEQDGVSWPEVFVAVYALTLVGHES